MAKNKKKRNIDHLKKKYKEVAKEAPESTIVKTKKGSSKSLKVSFNDIEERQIKSDLRFTISAVFAFAVIIAAIYIVDLRTLFIQDWSNQLLDLLVG